jgi:hypothetical protein
MNVSFYLPIKTQYHNLPIIIYPYNGVENVFDRNEQGCIETFINNLFDKHPHLSEATIQYFIVILWENDGNLMTDVWTFGEFESWQAGPSIRVDNFNNDELVVNGDVTAGDGLVMLGREEEQRRNSHDVAAYITGPRPHLPGTIDPKESFYL